jgi:2-polyprenyl-3-methyl-5-hydroxy-6-metoxy-1,4-benzoquinol methylase
MKTSPQSFRPVVPARAPATPAGSNGLRIGILIVAYNAVGTLAGVLRRIPADVLQSIEEVAVFDDASSDATYELAIGCQALTAAFKLTVIKNARNLGYGGNQKAGYKYFMDNGFDVVVLLHGDGQYAPEVLHELYAPIVRGSADAVFGSRMTMKYGGALHGGMPLYKFAGNRILSAYQNRALGLHLSEFHSGYRAYSVRALAKIDMSRMTDDFHFDTEIIIKLAHQGYRLAEVPIPTYYGNEICYVNGLKYARHVVRAVRRYQATIRSIRRWPEFAEYYIDYPFKEHVGSSHRIAQALIGTRGSVLDVGCGEGFFAARLAQDGNFVTGVDMIPAPRLRDAFAAYVCADLNAGLPAGAPALAGRRFDAILVLDVLQQLPNPAALLHDCMPLLAPAGRVFVSLPNVANISVRLALLRGAFRYSDRGILDERHLRFYTHASARALIEACGYEIVSERATAIPLEFALGLRRTHPLLRILAALTALLTAAAPKLFGYQWVFAARPRRP